MNKFEAGDKVRVISQGGIPIGTVLTVTVYDNEIHTTAFSVKEQPWWWLLESDVELVERVREYANCTVSLVIPGQCTCSTLLSGHHEGCPYPDRNNRS
jgi:hypothetical protein